MKTRALFLLLLALLLAGASRRIRARKRLAQRPVACAEVLGIAFAGGWRLGCVSDPALSHCSSTLSGPELNPEPAFDLHLDSDSLSLSHSNSNSISNPITNPQPEPPSAVSLTPGLIYNPTTCQSLALLPGHALIPRGHSLDLNEASASDFEALPGIGPSLASRIVAERAKGRFESVEDLERVRGIGPKRLEAVGGSLFVGE